MIGTPFGCIPAGGTEIPTFLSYATEKKLARGADKAEFGTQGAIEGVAGPGAAKNATVTAALDPPLTLGLPADNTHRVHVVPASPRVRLQAEKEGHDKIFKDFGAEWRNAGCSMCLGMNPDKMVARERSISTSNRNFEGRQGKGSRTHLASPAVAAATAIRGTICSPADL